MTTGAGLAHGGPAKLANFFSFQTFHGCNLRRFDQNVYKLRFLFLHTPSCPTMVDCYSLLLLATLRWTLLGSLPSGLNRFHCRPRFALNASTSVSALNVNLT
jgi:hypothetical protein